MTIYRAGELTARLAAALAEQPQELHLDLHEVSEFDTAGLQILLAARRHMHAAGGVFTAARASECVLDVLELCNLTDLVCGENTSARQ